MRTYLALSGLVLIAFGVILGLVPYSIKDAPTEGSAATRQVDCGSPFDHSDSETNLTTNGATRCDLVRPGPAYPASLIVFGVLVGFGAFAVPTRPKFVPQPPPYGRF